MKHIGLIGLAGSGKDTAAKALMKLGCRRLAFADELKSLAFYFGWDGEKDEDGRALLQELGMAARRYNARFWIQYLNKQILRERLQGPFVFTDVRFQNEADYVRSIGGIVVRIVRPGQIAENHESELHNNKKEHHHGGRIAGSSGTGIRNIAAPSRQPLRDGPVEGPHEGFYIITRSG